MSFPTQNLVRLDSSPVEFRAATAGGAEDGVMFGHFARFNEWTEIHSWFEGDFLERVAPTAFDRQFKDSSRIRCLYEHGRDSQIGNKPLGVADVLRADAKGAYYEVSLFDVPYVNDIKPALRAKQLGASFRFSIVKESVVIPRVPTAHNPQKLPERTLEDLDVPEFGPCTFGAYAGATSGLRSITDDYFDQLTNDPAFLVRMVERVGPKVVQKILDGAGDALLLRPPKDASDAPTAGNTGRSLAAVRTSIAQLQKGR